MKITQNNWLYNAGIIGLLRILRAKGITFDDQLRQGFFELLPEHLNGIPDSYFSFLIKSFPERFFGISIKTDDKGEVMIKEFKKKIQTKVSDVRKEKLNEIVSHKSFLNYNDAKRFVCECVEEFKVKTEGLIEKEFEEVFSTVEASETENKQKEKSLRALEKEKDKAIKAIRDYYDDLSKLFEKQKFAVDLLKRFYFNKNIIGNYSLSGNNRVEAFNSEFVTPAAICLTSNEEPEGVSCKFCNQKVLNLQNQKLVNIVFNEGLFSPSGVSVGFENFYFNLQPDLFICDVCELILLCAWAGFNRIPYRFRSSKDDTEFVFVNLPSLDLMLQENDRIQNLYKTASSDMKDTIYETVLSDLFVKEKVEKSQWVLQNVLFIEIKPVPRKDQAKPILRYFHVGKDVAELFIDNYAINSMKYISGWTEVQKNMNLYLKKEIVRRFLNSEPVYDLAFKILLQVVRNRKGLSYNLFCISVLDSIRRKIWIKHANSNQGGVKPMQSKQIYGVLKGISNAGANFVGAFEKDGTRDFERRQRLSYRILSLIRTGKYAAFYDVLMKLHIDAGKPIPEVLLGILNTRDSIAFEAKAYAFMSGFLKDAQTGQQTAEQETKTETESKKQEA